MSRCDQRKGFLGYCKKDRMHPGDHDNGKETWPRTGSDQKNYQEHLYVMEETELIYQAAIRAEKERLESAARRLREQQ
jgi:hypothetical protein